MEQVLNRMMDIMFDLKEIRCRTESYRNDADRGLNANCTAEAEGYPKDKIIENLFDYLADAKADLDRVVDFIKEVEKNLDDAIAEAEYEKMAEGIRK